jgi:hypothetical protein
MFGIVELRHKSWNTGVRITREVEYGSWETGAGDRDS